MDIHEIRSGITKETSDSVISNGILIYKKDDPDFPNNLRPISIIPLSGKSH